MKNKQSRYEIKGDGGTLTVIADSQDKAIYFYHLSKGRCTDISFNEFKNMKLKDLTGITTIYQLVKDDNSFIAWASGETDNEDLINQINANYNFHTQLKNELIERLKK